MRLIVLLWILSITGILSGCSYTSFLYNNAPWFVREKVDDYFSITSNQEQQLDRDIELFFKWHRYQELPEYANLITTFNSQFSDGLTREELVLFFEEVAAARTRFAEASLDSASQFLASTNSKQLDHYDYEFQQTLNEDREKIKLPIEQRNEENFNELLDTLEDWFGGFSEKQQQQLRTISNEQPWNNSDWLKRREQRHEEFLEFMQGKPDEAAIRMFLHNRLVQGLNQNPDRLRKQTNQFWLSAMLGIDRIITSTQRQRAISRLEDYRQDFVYLSRLGPEQLHVKVER